MPPRGGAQLRPNRVLIVIDLKLVREDPDAVRRSQRSRGEDPALVDALLEADSARRGAISAADTLRAEQKAASKSVGTAGPGTDRRCWRGPSNSPLRSRTPRRVRPTPNRL